MNKPTYEELEAQVKQLAAENAALKSNLMFWDAEDPESPYDCPEDIANNFAMDFNTEFDVQVAAKMPNRTYRVSEVGEYDCKIELVSGGMPETPITDAILDSLRAEGVEMLLTENFKAEIAGALADFDGVDDTTLQTVIWSGQPPEPDGDVWHIEYMTRGCEVQKKIREFAAQLRSKSEVQS